MIPNTKVAIFRLDASHELGLGHLYRCLTLAEELKARTVTCHFLIHAAHPAAEDLVLTRGHQIHLLRSDTVSTTISHRKLDAVTSTLIQKLRPALFIVDHYQLGVTYEQLLRPFVGTIVVLDDLANRPHDCDILIDPCPTNTQESYSRLVGRDTMLLLGLDYTLLRPEFNDVPNRNFHERFSNSVPRLLIFMGGTDPYNSTLAILQALQTGHLLEKLHTTVLIGPNSKHKESVSRFIESTKSEIDLICGSKEIAKLMTRMDLSIGASGSTSWERCALGLPSITFAIVDNQLPTGHALQKENASIFLGEWSESSLKNLCANVESLLQSPQRAQDLSNTSIRLVDGKGSQRIADKISESYKSPQAPARSHPEHGTHES